MHLDIIKKGYKPPWRQVAPQQRVVPRNPVVSQKAFDVLDVEVQGLLEKGAIREANPVPGQYVSSYIAVPKSKHVPDKWRLILNLKKIQQICSSHTSGWK